MQSELRVKHRQPTETHGERGWGVITGVIDMICAALRIKPEWLTWSEKKWTRVISETKLTAYELRKIETK